jgi:hypothetical protein
LKNDKEILQTRITQLEEKLAQVLQSVQKEKYYDGADVKQLFNISDSTLARYRRENKIPFTRFGNKILYPESFFTESLKKKMQNKHLL